MNTMKHLLGKKVLLLLIALGTFSVSRAQQVLHVNLEQALEIALNENPTIKIADMEVRKKEYVKKETQGNLLPNLSAGASYNRTLKKQVMYMGSSGGFADMLTEPLAEMLGPIYDHLGIAPPVVDSGSSDDSGDGGVTIGLANNWSGGFNLSLPIFAPSLYKAIKLTTLDIEASLEASRASRQDLVNQVTKAYYQLLLAQDSYEVLQRSYDQAIENFEVVNNKFIQGTVSEYDKIRAEVQVHNLKPSLVQAKNGIALTKLQLLVLMGVDVENIEINGNLNDYEEQMYVDLLKVDMANLANNTDLRTLEIQTRMLEENIKLDKTGYMPTLALTGSYQWIAMNDDFRFKNYKWNPYSVVGLSLSVPIYQGGTVRNKVKQSQIQLQQIDWTRINAERSLRMQAQSYVDNMNTSLEQLGSNKEGVYQAEKGRMIAQKRYEVGAGTILELNDSEVALTQAELAYNQSIYDFLVSKTDLDKVLGKDDYLNVNSRY